MTVTFSTGKALWIILIVELVHNFARRIVQHVLASSFHATKCAVLSGFHVRMRFHHAFVRTRPGTRTVHDLASVGVICLRGKTRTAKQQYGHQESKVGAFIFYYPEVVCKII